MIALAGYAVVGVGLLIIVLTLLPLRRGPSLTHRVATPTREHEEKEL